MKPKKLIKSKPSKSTAVVVKEDPKPGRPTLFNDLIREKMIALAESGKTNEQIAEIIGVHVRTIENWMGKDQELLWAVREAKQVADSLVEAALFSRAVGYSHKAVKFFAYEGSSWSEEYEQHHPPDVQAAQFWLKNRQPDRWREKSEIQHSGNISNLSDEELEVKYQEALKKAKGGS